MKQGSRARNKQRYQRFSSGGGVPPSSRSSGDLSTALAVAADSAVDDATDRPAPIGRAPQDLEDPPRSVVSQPPHPPRAHIEDDFFARGDDIASFPPSSVDSPEI